MRPQVYCLSVPCGNALRDARTVLLSPPLGFTAVVLLAGVGALVGFQALSRRRAALMTTALLIGLLALLPSAARMTREASEQLVLAPLKQLRHDVGLEAPQRIMQCASSDSLRLHRLPGEVAPTELGDHCAPLIGKALTANSSTLLDAGGPLSEDSLSMLEALSDAAREGAWANNLGNALYCFADKFALHARCGPALAGAGNVLGGPRSRLEGQPTSRGCVLATYCRDPSIGAGVCWGSFGYGSVLEGIRDRFRERARAVLSSRSQWGQQHPCTSAPGHQSRQSLATPNGSHTGRQLSEGHARANNRYAAIYLRCGDFLGHSKQGHVLLKFAWLEGMAKAAFRDVSRVFIVANRATHASASHAAVCEAIVWGLQERLQHQLPHATVSVAVERTSLEDFVCLTRAHVLVIAGWGSSFGHWAGMLNDGCAVVMPILQTGLRIGSKHGFPIAMREGLHYMQVPRSLALHIDEYNSSVLNSPAVMLALLGSGGAAKVELGARGSAGVDGRQRPQRLR